MPSLNHYLPSWAEPSAPFTIHHAAIRISLRACQMHNASATAATTATVTTLATATLAAAITTTITTTVYVNAHSHLLCNQKRETKILRFYFRGSLQRSPVLQQQTLLYIFEQAEEVFNIVKYRHK